MRLLIFAVSNWLSRNMILPLRLNRRSGCRRPSRNGNRMNEACRESIRYIPRHALIRVNFLEIMMIFGIRPQFCPILEAEERMSSRRARFRPRGCDGVRGLRGFEMIRDIDEPTW
jgi:hypothetical protein